MGGRRGGGLVSSPARALNGTVRPGDDCRLLMNNRAISRPWAHLRRRAEWQELIVDVLRIDGEVHL